MLKSRIMESQPFLNSKDKQNEQREYNHESDCKRISKFPTEFGHELEVHAIHRCYKSRRQEDDVYYGKDFDNLVLLYIDKTEESILEVVESVETKPCVFK